MEPLFLLDTETAFLLESRPFGSLTEPTLAPFYSNRVSKSNGLILFETQGDDHPLSGETDETRSSSRTSPKTASVQKCPLSRPVESSGRLCMMIQPMKNPGICWFPLPYRKLLETDLVVDLYRERMQIDPSFGLQNPFRFARTEAPKGYCTSDGKDPSGLLSPPMSSVFYWERAPWENRPGADLRSHAIRLFMGRGGP